MTLRESAEKLVNELYPCHLGCAHWDDQRNRHGADCKTWGRKAALSAVLAGMQVVLQGTPHLGKNSDGSIRIVDGHCEPDLDPIGYSVSDCIRLGGACRLRELE